MMKIHIYSCGKMYAYNMLRDERKLLQTIECMIPFCIKVSLSSLEGLVLEYKLVISSTW